MLVQRKDKGDKNFTCMLTKKTKDSRKEQRRRRLLINFYIRSLHWFVTSTRVCQWPSYIFFLTSSLMLQSSKVSSPCHLSLSPLITPLPSLSPSISSGIKSLRNPVMRRATLVEVARVNRFDPLVPKNWYDFRMKDLPKVKVK